MLLSYYKGWLECAKYPAELLWDQSYRLGFVNENEKVGFGDKYQVSNTLEHELESGDSINDNI